jgi:hypothetical protein
LVLRGPIQSALAKRGRSLESSWFLFWRVWKVEPGQSERWVTIVSGKNRVLGRMLSASDPAESKDILLSDPYFWDEQRKQWHGDGVRIAYFPEAKIEALYLSPTSGETAEHGYFDGNFNRLTNPKNGK